MSAEKKGIMISTPSEIRRSGWKETIQKAAAHTCHDTESVYVSVDIDSVDQ